jgi:archaellum component FlaF (FlaF/FlaG flagellin family)
MKQLRILAASLLLFVLLSQGILAAPDRVIINSADWHDVYSGMLYASLSGIPSNFLVSQKHGAILLYSIPTAERSPFVVSSRSQPYVVGYASFLTAKGYDNATELVTRNANLDLARDLTSITKFIVIDPAYGYNAISAAPYAVQSRQYVLFADRRNIDEVLAFLQGRPPASLLVLGQVDREVKDALAPFNPETVNTGDRFSNNLVMVDRYLQLKPTKQVILSNGEFLEAGIMSGADPVVYIGRTNVPDAVQQYIKKSDIEVGILIGNELIGTATTVRRQLGISVFVKFAQGARTPQGAIAQVEDLDRFPMPRYDLSLEIVSIVYNKATRSLEVTYRNPTDLALYFKSTLTINDGGTVKVTGDNDPLFLDKRGTKTVVYTAATDGTPLLLQGENLTAQVLTIYGEGPKSLENTLQATLSISQVEVKDDTAVNITDLYYDKSRQEFVATIENVGPVDAYVEPEMENLLINDEPVTVAAERAVLIKKGRSASIPIAIAMAEADFAANPQVTVRAYYGERELSLIKITEKSFPLRFGGGYGQYVPYAVVVAVILILLLFLGTKKKCKHCGHRNARGRKTCEKCGEKL